MGRKRERGFPPDPEPLPVPVADNHTHLDAIAPLVAEHVVAARHDERTGSDGMVDGRDGMVDEGWPPRRVPTPAEHVERAVAAGVDRLVQVGCDLVAIDWTDALLRGDVSVWNGAGTLGTRDADQVVTTAEQAIPDRPQDGTGRDRMFGARGPAAQAARVLGAVAIHPNEAVLHAGVREVGPDGLEPDPSPHHSVSLDDAIARVADVARANPRVRAIGETGMDLFRTGPQGEKAQRAAFRAHVALAKELGLALQIHDRDAHAQVIDVLLADGAPERTVFHCYSGDEEMAALAAEHGWYLSFAGPVTYPRNDHLRAALRAVPLELVLVETDAPYLPPHPYRGRPNAPYVVAHTVRAMADVLDRPLAEVCTAVSANSDRVYGAW